MPKITTSQIKTLISTLLADKGEDILGRLSFADAEDEKQVRGVLHFILDGHKWRRDEKTSLGKFHALPGEKTSRMTRLDWLHELQEAQYADLAGRFDREVFDTVADLGKCKFRVFTPRHPEWEDGWRFEIVTTPDETQIVSYGFVAD